MSQHPHFIQGAIHHPGAFRSYCQHHGYGGVTNACIKEGEHSHNHLTEERAHLARTLAHLRHHKRHPFNH